MRGHRNVKNNCHLSLQMTYTCNSASMIILKPQISPHDLQSWQTFIIVLLAYFVKYPPVIT